MLKYLKRLELLFSVILALQISSSTSQSAGTLIYGYKNYTVLEVGNINLLLSIPHDGNLKPTNIRDRTVDTVIDYNTQNFGKAVRDELIYLFKTVKNMDARPFVVYTNLHRFFELFYSSKILLFLI
jgi:hypothetical protein